MEITQTTAFVTGANRGIGKAFVNGLAAAGARKIYAGARDASALSQLESAFPGLVLPVMLDVTDPVCVQAAAAQAGDVNLLINNAGASFGGGVTNGENFEGARAEMEVNYFGLLNMTRAFAPQLIANSPGAIINVLSILGLIGFPRAATYSASKAAALSATRAIRAELAGDGISVIAVMPGFVDTDMTAKLDVPKIRVEDVVAATFRALQDGDEDVYPGDSAAELARGFFHDPKMVEHQMAAFGAGV
jgi:NAD(P)-dependent dehydrogenase (short-subunit alcohol dehydrogenase family)